MADEQKRPETSIDIRRKRFEQTSAYATATIDAERQARQAKTERLRLAREARDTEAKPE